MDLVRVARWRDAALVLLAVEAFAVGLVPALLLYWSLRILPQLRERLLEALLQVREVLCKVQNTTRRAAGAVARPFIWLQSASAALSRALQCLRWRSE